MDRDRLVELITAEVMRQLRGEPSPAVGSLHKALVVFTGGTTGLDIGLEQLSMIQGFSTELTIVLSAAAERIVGADRIRGKLGSRVRVICGELAYPELELREADMLLVPVLTQNTASKLAHTLCDTMASTLILQALMVGKTVIAASNAAELHGTRGAAALREAFRSSLRKIETYGVQLTSVDNLASATQQSLRARLKATDPEPIAQKRVLDAETVKAVARGGVRTITITQGTIVTPLAYDLAKELHMEIIRTEVSGRR